MKPQLHIRIFDHNNLKQSDMKDLSYLILPIYIQDPKQIYRSVAQQEWFKYWIGITVIIVFFLSVALLAASLNLYCTFGVIPIFMIFMRTTVSTEEMNRNISRLSSKKHVLQMQQARTYLANNPFMIHRNNVLFENIPQLIVIDKLLIQCKEESDNSCVQLSTHRQAFETLQKQNIQNELLLQLEVRLEVLNEIVQEFEGVYRILLGAKNRIQQERERLRMIAQNRDNVGKLDVFDNSSVLIFDREKLEFYDRILIKCINTSNKLDSIWKKRFEDRQMR